MYFASPPLMLGPRLMLDDEKWDGKLVAVGMAQGTYPMENITSAKFRIFLAERAINYLFIANMEANVLLTNTNIGCPNISFEPSTLPPVHPTPPMPYRPRLTLLLRRMFRSSRLICRLRIIRIHGLTHPRKNNQILPGGPSRHPRRNSPRRRPRRRRRFRSVR